MGALRGLVEHWKPGGENPGLSSSGVIKENHDGSSCSQRPVLSYNVMGHYFIELRLKIEQGIELQRHERHSKNCCRMA